MMKIFLRFKPCLLTVIAVFIVVCQAMSKPSKTPGPSIPDKTFIFHNAIRDLKEFRAYAEIAAHLKPFGKVEIDIGVLAEKSPMHKVNFRSGWHEYGAYMATLWAFFPHPKLAPYLPQEWVELNRKLLLGKVAILKELGLDAVFSVNETQFLPEAFFRQYPHLRGPRVDAPARSTRAEFAWCVDQPETLEMIEWMMTELKRHAPQVQELQSWNNDSGSGFCWATSLYPGPNGPDYCQGIDAGVRVQGLNEALDKGARKGGGSIRISMAGNISKKDQSKIEPLLPSFAKFGDTYAVPLDSSYVLISSQLMQAYPVRGIIDVQAVLKDMNRFSKSKVRVLEINTDQTWYYRADETIPTVRHLVDIVEDGLKHQTGDQSDTNSKLRELVLRWGGESNADSLVTAFNLIRKCFSAFSFNSDNTNLNNVVIHGEYVYTAASRTLTRPLLFKPELLTPEEEAYFLPYVYAAEDNEARLDYKLVHGDRRFGLTEYHSPAYRNICEAALHAAKILAQISDAPEKDWFIQLSLSLRLWASTIRSNDNYYFAQEIRDRHPQELAALPHRIKSYQTQEPDLLLWNKILRDELDNANEFRVMLEQGGLDLIAHARESRNEDSFLYGPDIVGAINKKVDLMVAHWLDAQRYLGTVESNGK